MSSTYIIVTSKPGKFHSELIGTSIQVETYEYYFHSELKAKFSIHQIEEEVQIKITDETLPVAINIISSKFLPRFDHIKMAQKELKTLIPNGSKYVRLDKK
jgi:hypothetical protein